jgi:hypothetical protein
MRSNEQKGEKTMALFLAFMFGWVGGYWPRHWDPDDVWPPNCPMCGAILGGIAAVILEAVLKPVATGVIEHAVLDFFVGAFASTLVAGLLRLAKPRARTVNG